MDVMKEMKREGGFVVYEQGTEMKKFLAICKRVIPERVSLVTNYGEWEDRIVMKGPLFKSFCQT